MAREHTYPTSAARHPLSLAFPSLTFWILLPVFAICGLGGQCLLAQGLLVDVSPERHVHLPRPIIIVPRPEPRPEPEASYKIESLEVNATLVDQVAKVQVAQSFVNTGSRQLEVCFVFPLPYDGAVDRLTLMVDGKEYEAKLLKAEEARKQYEAIVRKNQDPALLEWVGTGMFKTSVFPVPPGAKRTVTLRYSQLCRKTQGVTDFLFPLSTAKYTSHPLEKLHIRLAIESSAEIKNVYSPTHEADIERPDSKHAVVKLEQEDCIPTEDFRLLFDIGKGPVAANVVSYRPDNDEDGYFLLLASPELPSEVQEPTKKTVLFVVDRSGSMSGKKIEQAREALKFVLNNLHEGDLFNVIAYDSEVEAFRPELQKYDEESRQAAIGFVNGLYAGGSTNIADALKTALGQLQDSSRPSFVIFLSDGLPTVGETNEAKIVETAGEKNDARARLFPFGVGYDVNSRLLDKLARENFGQSEYVRPNEDIESAVSTLYNRIGSPVMTDVEITFDVEGARTEDGKAINRVYPSGKLDLFAGDQLVVVGRYRKPGDAKVVIRGQLDGEEKRFDFPAELVEHSTDSTNAFVSRLWATRRVGEILDELDLKGHNEELVKELVSLATEHGILTRYTSFLADETTNLSDLAQVTRGAELRLRESFEAESGEAAFGARLGKATLQRAARAPAGGYGGGYGFNAPAADSARVSGGYGGVAGGIPADADGLDGYGLGPAATYYDAVEQKQVHVRTVRTIAGKTFLLRGERWIESTLSDKAVDSAEEIERYSDEYFELARQLGKQAGQLLAADAHLVVQLADKVYELK
jgi:Ca-activated chloride channel family protein